MLECGTNFKGTLNTMCKSYNLIDNENHRLNECPTQRTKTTSLSNPYVNFNDIYSTDKTILTNVIRSIEQLWNTKTAHGSTKL